MPRAHDAGMTNLAPRTRSITLAAAVTTVALAAAAPAHAAQQWNPGNTEQSTVSNCNFDPETGIIANAEFQADPASLPRVGDVFYVRTIPGRVGNGCGGDMSVHVEVVPPAGVTPAISSATPVRCSYLDIDSGAVTPANGCPQAGQEGVYGIAFDQLTPGGSTPTYPWAVPYGKALIVEIPLRSSRRLAGGTPSCSRSNGAPPCSSNGDVLQFADKVIDGYGSPWLSPYVGLFVEDAAGGGGTPGGTVVIASAPHAVKIARLLHGLSIKVSVPAEGSRVVAKLSAKRLHGIATRTVRNAHAGTLTVKLKASGKAARALRRSRRALKATLKVSVSPPQGSALSATRTLTLKP
jgi:post-segregation antitoxin (ccd killing protein)